MNSHDSVVIEAGVRHLGESLPEVSRLFKSRLAAAVERAAQERRRQARLPLMHWFSAAFIVAGLLGNRFEDLPAALPSSVVSSGPKSGRPEAGDWWRRAVPTQTLEPLPEREGEWGLVEVAILDRDDIVQSLTDSQPLRRHAGWRSWNDDGQTV